MSKVFGIDLGTTNSLIAVVKEGKPEVIANEDGEKLVPSVVGFSDSDSVVVGSSAKDRKVQNIHQTVYSIKRLMGKGVHDISEERKMLPFNLSQSSEQIVRVSVGKKNYTPIELSSMVLKELKTMAETSTKETVTDVVVTVPAYFDDGQRQATRLAGKLAGLNVLRIVNEPTAAALAYGLEQKKNGLVAVYDFGGGTFDVSILKLKDGVFEVVSTNGNTLLGGDDIDRAFAMAMDRRVEQESGISLLSQPQGIALLTAEAERAKVMLSESKEVHVSIEIPGSGTICRQVWTRRELEKLAEPILEKTLLPCAKALKDAGIKREEINEVVLVGGPTRMPFLRAMIEEFFGKKPHIELNPDEVVALGAAIQGDILSGERTDMLLLDVVPLSLGIETMGGGMAKLIHRNTTIPTSAREVFTTYADNQNAVDIHVFQGEREMVKDNRSLAQFKLKGIPAQAAGLARVEVSLLIDANGVLRVRAKDLHTKSEQEVEVNPTYGLNDEAVEKMLEASIENAEADFRERLVVEARNQADTLLRATERALKNTGTDLPKIELDEIKAGVSALEGVLEQNDHTLIREKIDRLDKGTRRLAELVMARTLQSTIKGQKVTDVLGK